jgi:hypothetical protein
MSKMWMLLNTVCFCLSPCEDMWSQQTIPCSPIRQGCTGRNRRVPLLLHPAFFLLSSSQTPLIYRTRHLPAQSLVLQETNYTCVRPSWCRWDGLLNPTPKTPVVLLTIYRQIVKQLLQRKFDVFFPSAPPDETIEKSPITTKTVSPITGFYMDSTFNLNADAKSGNKCEVWAESSFP